MVEADIAEQERALASLQLPPVRPVSADRRQFRVWLLRHRGHPPHADMRVAEIGAGIMADLRHLPPNDPFTREMIDGALQKMECLQQWFDCVHKADTVWELFEEAAVMLFFALLPPAEADAWMLGTIQGVVFHNLMILHLGQRRAAELSKQIEDRFDIAGRDTR